MKLKDICCACLSLERKLSPINSLLDGVNELFFLLSLNSEIDQDMFDKHRTHFNICWECSASLRRVRHFRRQVCVAHRQLISLLRSDHDIDQNQECLSKLSYSFKRSFDKELVYGDVLSKETDTTDDEPGIDVDIKSDDSEPSIEDIKTEIVELKEFQEENPFPVLNYTDNIKEEIKNTNNDFVMKPEEKIKNGDGDFVTTDITNKIIEERKPKRKVILKRKAKDTAKRILSERVKCKNLIRIKEDLEVENKNVNEHVSKQKVQKEPTAPKTRQPRKVQIKPKVDLNYPCTECGQVFTTYTKRYEHVTKYHQEGYQCATCGKKFHIKKSFLRHERIHIAKTQPREQCPICNVLVRCDLVQEHARRHALNDSSTYRCAPCNKQFANKNSYKKHMTEAKAHLADLENKYECETCHKAFPTLMLYNCHMRYTKRHAVQAAVYKCSMCDKSFRTPSALRDHVNYVHMGKTRHKCAVCDKALASPQCVARHMKLFHGGYKHPKNKLCVTCGKAFASKKELREHEFVHTGERPLKCDVCGDTFRQSGALYTHKRRVHKVPLKPSVELVTEPDETVERLIMNCELTETELIINRVINAKKDYLLFY